MKGHIDLEVALIMAKKFKELRLQANLSQEDCGYILSLTRASIANVESGEHGITCKLLLKACKLFNCSPLDILPTEKEITIEIRSMSSALESKADKRIKQLEEKLAEWKAKKKIIISSTFNKLP